MVPFPRTSVARHEMGDITADSPLDYDPRGVPLSQRIVERVSDAEGVDPLELDPLYTVVDPDALDSLFRTRLASSDGLGGELRFEYHDYEVRVTADGRVTLADPLD